MDVVDDDGVCKSQDSNGELGLTPPTCRNGVCVCVCVYKSQDSNGELGLTVTCRMSSKPVAVMQKNPCIKIVSGNEHLVCLTCDNTIFTMGMNH